MKNFFNIISLILILSPTSVVLANEECYCTAGCKSRGDPHVRDFTGVESKIPETGLKTLYSLQGVKIMTEVTEQNKGLYQTHIKITNYSETIYDKNAKTDCQKLSNKYKFEIYPSDINDPKNIVENQKVYG